MPLKSLLSISELEKQDENFFSRILNYSENSEELFGELYARLGDDQPLADREYLMPYFRWLTYLVWWRYSGYSEEIAIGLGIQRQIPVALMCGIDVLNEILWYLGLRAFYDIPDDRSKMFKKMQKAFLESEAIIGENGNQIFTIKDAVREIKLINSKGRSSIETAELIRKIKITMFPDDPLVKKFFTEDQDKAVYNFVELIDFFLETRPEEVKEMVEAFLHPEIGQVSSGPSEIEDENQYLSIKKQIETKFEKDASGEFVNNMDVLNELENLAEANGDENIRQLYYFNEQDGKFEWNEQLLETK